MEEKDHDTLPDGKALADLNARLRKLKSEVSPDEAGPDAHGGAAGGSATGLGMALAVAGHLVSGLLVGGGIGYFLDQWLETSPLWLLIFFFLGAAAGLLNTYRTVRGMGMALGYRPLESVGGGPKKDETHIHKGRDA